MARNLELNLGVRSSDYEFSGRVETYKADGLWEPFKGFTFRGGYEHAIRAPNIGELYNQIGVQAQINANIRVFIYLSKMGTLCERHYYEGNFRRKIASSFKET